MKSPTTICINCNGVPVYKGSNTDQVAWCNKGLITEHAMARYTKSRKELKLTGL